MNEKTAVETAALVEELSKEFPEELWWLAKAPNTYYGRVINRKGLLCLFSSEAEAWAARHVRPCHLVRGYTPARVTLETAIDCAKRGKTQFGKGSQTVDAIALFDRNWNELMRRYVR